MPVQMRSHIRDISGKDSAAPSASTPIPCPHCHKPTVKPSIVLHGRDLPLHFTRCKKSDFSANKMDLLFVMGSSLTAQPACRLPDEAGSTCHRVLVNRKGAGHFDLFGRQRHRMINESKTPDDVTNVEQALKEASKAGLNRMLNTIDEWKQKLKKSSELTAKYKTGKVKVRDDN